MAKTYLLKRFDIVDVDARRCSRQTGDGALGTGHGTHVLSPLCVVAPLAKKSASTYGIPPATKMTTEPMTIHEMM